MTAQVASMSVRGEWICRDKDGWRVRVPTQNGHGYFSIKEYGSASKALNAARAFHTKMCRQLQKDREYYKQHGEIPKRETLNIRNRSGYTGIARMVYPVLEGRPTIVYQAYYQHKGRQITKRFSTVEFKHEEYALEAAIEWRKEMLGRK